MKHSVPALKVFFATEMWERYGFYVVQTLLALYLLEHFHLADVSTYSIVGSFTAATYVSPFIGGVIADRFLGHKRAVLWGAVLLALSYMILAVYKDLTGTTLALACISMGTGLLKPNISGLLGYQFKANQPGRDSTFTLFYVGISCGIVLGTTLPSYLHLWFGWGGAFFSGTIGLILAFFTFLIGSRYYQLPDNAADKLCDMTAQLKSLSMIAVFIVLAYEIIHHQLFADIVFVIIGVGSFFTVLGAAYQESGHQRKRTLAFLLLCIISGMFWALYFQMFLSLTLFIHRAVTPTILGIYFPAPYYVTVESIGLIVFGPVLAWFWGMMRRHHKRVTTPAKFTWAMGFLLIAYLLIVYTAGHPSIHGIVEPGYLLVAYLLIAIGELLLSPVGLSVATRLVRPELIGVMVGVFFVSLGIGGKLAGWLAELSDIPVGLSNAHLIDVDYYHAFVLYSKIAAAAFMISLVLMPIIKRLIRTQ